MDLKTVLVIAGIVVAVILITGSMKPQIKVIKEGTQVSIYYRGQFSRVAGPGWVPMVRFETIEREFSVRNEPRYYSVDGLLFYAQPIGLTLSFYSQFDPQRAAGKDKDLLRRLVMFSDDEREQQVEHAIRATMISRLGAMERRKPLPPKATVVDRILPLLPGTPDCNALLAEVRKDLEPQLRAFGVFIDPAKPFMLTEIMPPADLIKTFSAGRVIDALRLKMPGAHDDVVLQTVAAIQGLDLAMRRDTYVLTGAAAQEAQLELKKGEEETEAKLKFRPRPVQEAEKPSAAKAEPAEARPAGQKETLTKDDLSYLKRIPRNGQRTAA